MMLWNIDHRFTSGRASYRLLPLGYRWLAGPLCKVVLLLGLVCSSVVGGSFWAICLRKPIGRELVVCVVLALELE
jgi:hypothetical protein